MALGKDWLNDFYDDDAPEPTVAEQTRELLTNEEQLSPQELANRINQLLINEAAVLNRASAEVQRNNPLYDRNDHDAGRRAFAEAVDSLRQDMGPSALYPETAEAMSQMDYDGLISRELGEDVSADYADEADYAAEEAEPMAQPSYGSSGANQHGVSAKVATMLRNESNLTRAHLSSEINAVIKREAEELIVTEFSDSVHLDDLDARGIEDKPEGMGRQRYTAGRMELASAIQQVQKSRKVMFDAETADQIVSLDDDGLMSQQLGMEVSEVFGRNPMHASQRPRVDFSKQADPSVPVPPVLRQPRSELSPADRDAQREALAASQPAPAPETLTPAAEAVRAARERLRQRQAPVFDPEQENQVDPELG